jgi:hypothetical protein
MPVWPSKPIGYGATAPRLTDPRIQAFLATKEVVVLSTAQLDGGPLAMPMWFLSDHRSGDTPESDELAVPAERNRQDYGVARATNRRKTIQPETPRAPMVNSRA